MTFYKFLNKRQVDLLDGIFKYLLLNLLETQRDEFEKIRWQFVVVLELIDKIIFFLWRRFLSA